MALESEDKRDPKRAHVVLSKGHKVLGRGYSRVTGVAAEVTNKSEFG
jgi:transketolase N-terminal domain/subunit